MAQSKWTPSNKQLIKNALGYCMQRGDRPTVLWKVVREVFILPESAAKQLCKNHKLNPHEIIPGANDE